MKKIISFGIIALMLISLVLAAPPTPSTVQIVLKVNGDKVDYDNAKITNTYTGEILTPNEVGSLAITEGIGLFDLLDFKQGFEVKGRNYAGDRIQVKACDYNSQCVQYFNIEDTNPRTIRFDIWDSNIVIESITCYDGSKVKDISMCPEPTQPEIIEIPIEVIKEVPVEVIVETENNDNNDVTWLMTLFGSLVALVLGILGTKYKWISPLMKAWQTKINNAKTNESKKKAISGAIKTAKTVLKKDQEGKYKK